MTRTVVLPTSDGAYERYRMSEPGAWTPPSAPASSRLAYAAAHVVPRALGDNTPGQPADLDWDVTLSIRHQLWDWGLGVAEAMDTAQRGMGLDWAACQELVRRSASEAKSRGARIVAGAGTDQPARPGSLAQVVEAYREQLAFLDGAGVTAVVMASRDLARIARTVDDYRYVYDTLLGELTRPVLLHWLGDMFDPALSGYWGSADLDVASETFVGLVRDHARVVAGVKVSLLDESREVALRTVLPDGVLVYTGDDFNYPQLIAGDGTHHSHALLGAFAAIAPAAATALAYLDKGDALAFRTVLAPTVPLSRHVFEPPTRYYKTGIAFVSWLNGWQPGFALVDGLHSGRSVPHLVRAFRLADQAGLLLDPDLAADRMWALLVTAGTAP